MKKNKNSLFGQTSELLNSVGVRAAQEAALQAKLVATEMERRAVLETSRITGIERMVREMALKAQLTMTETERRIMLEASRNTIGFTHAAQEMALKTQLTMRKMERRTALETSRITDIERMVREMALKAQLTMTEMERRVALETSRITGIERMAREMALKAKLTMTETERHSMLEASRSATGFVREAHEMALIMTETERRAMLETPFIADFKRIAQEMGLKAKLVARGIDHLAPKEINIEKVEAYLSTLSTVCDELENDGLTTEDTGNHVAIFVQSLKSLVNSNAGYLSESCKRALSIFVKWIEERKVKNPIVFFIIVFFVIPIPQRLVVDSVINLFLKAQPSPQIENRTNIVIIKKYKTVIEEETGTKLDSIAIVMNCTFVYQTPSRKSGTLGVVHKGEIISRVEKNKKWVLIEFKDSISGEILRGYVRSKYLKSI